MGSARTSPLHFLPSCPRPRVCYHLLCFFCPFHESVVPSLRFSQIPRPPQSILSSGPDPSDSNLYITIALNSICWYHFLLGLLALWRWVWGLRNHWCPPITTGLMRSRYPTCVSVMTGDNVRLSPLVAASGCTRISALLTGKFFCYAIQQTCINYTNLPSEEERIWY